MAASSWRPSEQHWLPLPDSVRRLFWIGMRGLLATRPERPSLDGLADGDVALLATTIETDLHEVREARRELRASIVQMFASVLLATSFLTPVIIDHRRAGPAWLHWLMATAALALSVYTGTMFGVLLISSRFEDGAMAPCLVTGWASSPRVAVGLRAEQLAREAYVVVLLRAGFSRMVRVAWLALFMWMWLAIRAALGGR